MKKIFVILLFSSLFGSFVSAQVIVNLQIPMVGLTLKSQLWNMTITNTANEVLTMKINMIMTDIATGQQVFSGATNFITVPQGSKILQYNDVLPVVYVVLNNNYGVDASSNGFLPLGNFNVCFEILKLNHEVIESLAEECSLAQIEPLSPPFLISPDDQSEIDDIKPLFTWLPPAPVSLFSNLNYNFKLVEVLPNQNSADAIQQNLPIISSQNISTSSLLYPSANPGLDTGKIYAWQIAATNNNVVIANSDIWIFKVKVFGPDNLVYQRESSYFKLSREIKPAYFVCDGLLKFEYIDELNDSTVAINIYDISNQARKSVLLDNDSILLHFGQNLVDIDLKNNTGLISGHLYSIEIINSKQELWNGKFEFKPNN